MNRRNLFTRGLYVAAALWLRVSPAEEPGPAPALVLPTFDQVKKSPPPPLITPSIIVRECLFQLDNALTFPAYGRTFHGCKLGDTVQLDRYRADRAVLAFRKNISVELESKDLVAPVDRFTAEYLTPAMQEFARDAVRAAASMGIHDPMIVMADLEVPEWIPIKARANWRGLSIRVVWEYDMHAPAGGVPLLHFDFLYGIASREPSE